MPRPAEKSGRPRRDRFLAEDERVAAASRIFVSLKRSYSLIQALGVLAILVIVMQIANDRFLSPVNVGNLLGQMTMMLIVAAGMTIVDRRRVRRFGRFRCRLVGCRRRLDHGPLDSGVDRC